MECGGRRCRRYFWHITDFHYDPFFSINGDTRKGCWRADTEGGPRNYRKPTGRYGDYGCDSPWELVESAARIMGQRQADNVEFVLWTGDAMSHSIRRYEKALQLEYMQNLTDLLTKTFSSQFVFPALGHDDPGSQKQLGRMWSRWLPTDSMKTFESGGYYLIERKTHKLQIIVLNTNLMTKGKHDEDANKQWEWLNKVLVKCEHHKETVYIAGHIPPGSDERQGTLPDQAYSDYYNKKYLQIVRKYSKIIVGQFFGHLHSDTYRIFYDEEGTPVSWAFIAPSLTPRRLHVGHNNPGLRLYKFDRYTGEIIDYSQYYLDLPKTSKEDPNWQVEYNFSSYYGISQITPLTLHGLAEKLTLSPLSESQKFTRYFRANSVGVIGGCGFGCALHHYCAITRVDFVEFEICMDRVSGALASSTDKTFRSLFYSRTFLLTVIVILNAALISIL
ncbi:acid sphingomyelinase-like phosphodiesterase 3a [Agrilus planipennis]|uniref:Acid sphingomyelinase-like phosphodiesterase 3a n=1 Tax=Agrilus planipennis TaxID=224129 RepID=A0A1W4X5I9_AGRPL|nr:acid sphingomyelinase-like phosphodiesterase 3a [Agrilus planipennis]